MSSPAGSSVRAGVPVGGPGEPARRGLDLDAGAGAALVGRQAFVLVLLGLAATDFLITMTLSGADAAAHVLENPYAPAWLHGHLVLVTLVLLGVLGAVFLRGFKEAIGIAVVLVVYLSLNTVVMVAAIAQVIAHPQVIGDWTTLLHAEGGPQDTARNPAGRIAGTHKMLTAAAR